MPVTIKQLQTITIFASLKSSSLGKLSGFSRIDFYESGSLIIQQGDRFLPKLYAVLTGQITAQKISSQGKVTILRQLPAGEMFAAPALFGDGIAPATLIAQKNTEVVSINKSVLLELMHSNPEVSLEILSCFNQRLQEMHQTIHGLISESATIRMARLIQYNASRYGVEQTNKGACLNTKLPHQQLARSVGITYEESVRLIKKDFAAIIDYGRGGIITIQDGSALKLLSSES